MYATTYIKAKDVADAVSQLRSADEGKLLAGGQTLIPTLKQRLTSSDRLIDLTYTGLSGISDEGSSIRIGAMTRHVEVETSELQEAIPA